MADYVTLMGAEQVQSAGRTISSAADSMQSAASNFGAYVEQLGRVLSAHEENMTVLLEHHREEMAKIMKPAYAIDMAPLSEQVLVVPNRLQAGTAYAEGQQAYRNGATANENPYAPGTPDFQRWDNGRDDEAEHES